MPPEVTAIVVSYNAAAGLRRCLTALSASRGVRLRTIVVDNASREDNLELVRREFAPIELIANHDNRGFAAAANQGIERARGNVVLINPDLEVEPETLITLQKKLDHYPRVGVVGPKLGYPDGRPQPSVKRFPRWVDLFLILSKLPNVLPHLTRRYNGLDVAYEREQVVDQVMGACFYIRRETLEQVGRFDANFFVWFEEVDFCRRAKRMGWDTLYTPATRATHQRGASMITQTATARQQILRSSIVHYAHKYFGLLGVLALAPALLISLVSGWLIDALALTKPVRARDL